MKIKNFKKNLMVTYHTIDLGMTNKFIHVDIVWTCLPPMGIFWTYPRFDGKFSYWLNMDEYRKYLTFSIEYEVEMYIFALSLPHSHHIFVYV